MTIFFLLLAFIVHEYNIDGFHTHGKNTYRVLQWDYMSNDFDLNHSARVGAYLANNYPQISQLTHVVTPGFQFLKANGIVFQEKAVLAADSSFLGIFSFNLLSGNPKECLNKPYSMVLTKSAGRRYFGEVDPLNKVIDIGDQAYHVTGVMDDLNGRSHLRFEVLISASSYPVIRQGILYLSLKDATDAEMLTEELNKNYKKVTSSRNGSKIEKPFKLQTLKDCYYTNPENYQSDVFHSREKKTLYLILSIMLVVLVISSFNFINFSQARVIFRSKEINVYRLFGANIVASRVFILETFFLSTASLVIAVIISLIILPYFNVLIGSFLTVDYITSPLVLGISLLIFLLVTIVLGGVAYLLYSRIHANNIFKGDYRVQPRPMKLLNAFVMMQIAISILLALISVSITAQISFIENSDLGFNTKNVIDVNLMNLDSIRNPQLFKNKALEITGVVSASVCMGTPLDGRGYTNIESGGEMTELNFVSGDLDYLRTIGFELINGRGFRTSSDSSYALINEAGLKYYRLDKDLQPQDAQAAQNVIGLVRDFHFKSFRDRITPVEIHLVEKMEIDPFGSSRLLVLTDGSDRSIINELENAWKQVYLDVPFEYSFVSDTYFNIYEKERNYASLIVTGCLVSIIITLFGLIGVTFFGAHRRLKEFAIRKVYGATVNSILKVSIKQAMLWTVLGSIAAIPPAVYFIDSWLDNFSYKADIPFLLYVIVIFMAAMITSLSVLYQTIVVARVNPADILRHE